MRNTINITTEGAPPNDYDSEVIELWLLLPSDQAAALKAVAVRLHLTVGELVRQAIGDFLQAPAAGGFVGEVPGRPTAPLAVAETS